MAWQVYWATERHRELTDESGNFQIAVLPGKGHLMVKAPTDEYESQERPRGELFRGKPASDYYCMEGLQAIEPKPGNEPFQTTVALRVGGKVFGTLVGPNKEQVEQALMLLPTYSPLWINSPNFRPRTVQSNWQVRGIVGSKPTLVSFINVDRELGATIELNAASVNDQPQAVQLARCGTAKAKLVDQENQPFEDFPYTRGKQPLCILVVEGTAAAPFDDFFLGFDPNSIHWAMEELTYDRYQRLSTDKEGNIVFPLLIPDAQYVLYTYNAGRQGTGPSAELRSFARPCDRLRASDCT